MWSFKLLFRNLLINNNVIYKIKKNRVPKYSSYKKVSIDDINKKVAIVIVMRIYNEKIL